jgi:IS1 family transposase
VAGLRWWRLRTPVRRTALDADTKLMISCRLGDRTLATAYDFMHDVAERISNRIQLTTDGHRVYLEAVESASIRQKAIGWRASLAEE